MSNDKTFEWVVREYLPDATDKEVDCILWEHTGFPFFFKTDDTEACLREQLEEFLLEIKVLTHTKEVGE